MLSDASSSEDGQARPLKAPRHLTKIRVISDENLLFLLVAKGRKRGFFPRKGLDVG